jgi:ABC-type phosphate transport system substrate-binding protein
MKKQILSVAAVAGLSVASLAGAAEINIYGASAQFDFLNADAISLVQQYCTTTLPVAAIAPAVNGNGYVIQYKTALGNTIKNGVVTGTNCGTASGKPAIPGSTDNFLTLRYSGFGSGEGITTMTKTAPLDPEFAAGCNIALGERRQAPAGLTANNTMAATATLATYQAATVCKPVNIGTSDVAFDQFTQTADDSIVSATGLNTIVAFPPFAAPTGVDNKTLAVPFAFYVNPGVKAYHCVASTDVLTGTGKHTGGVCTPSGLASIAANTEQCSTGSVCETTASTIDNISRLQASILYSGQILDWNELGGYFPANPVKICLRKPGSGTHVAFDETVMRAAAKNDWGVGYNQLANNDLGNLMPFTSFNGSTTDMKNCLSGTEGLLTPAGAVVPFTGAIGYMDADNADAATYVQVKYNGVKPNRTNVRNGAYEFYTIGHMYAENTPLANAVVAFVQNPANVPSGKAKYWASVNEMIFARGNDYSYPSKATKPTGTNILTP